jgi:2-pyrone-4,6-dicarboxylate lactonase
VRGARFSFRRELGAVLSEKDFARAIARIRELGWYAKIQPEKDGIVSSVDGYQAVDVPVLIDHMARPDPSRGKDDPNLRKMLELLSRGNLWVMLSLGEKTSKAGPPWDDVTPIARAYIEAAPDRCVWATNGRIRCRSCGRPTTPICWS